MDRVYAPWVTTLAAMAAITGLLLFAQVGHWGIIAALVGIGLGLATGIESDVIAYLASRYFPRGVYSSILGLMVASYIAGAAIGPVAFTTGERFAGDAVWLVISACLVIGAMHLSLGRYRCQG